MESTPLGVAAFDQKVPATGEFGSREDQQQPKISARTGGYFHLMEQPIEGFCAEEGARP